MKPSFSLHYNGRRISSLDLVGTPIEGGERFVLDESFVITLKKTEYRDFGAVEWVLWLENPSDRDSAVAKEICDADLLLPLDLPAPPPPDTSPVRAIFAWSR